MTTYKELLQQREQLEKQITEARQRENQAAIEKVRSLVAEFGLTSDDIFVSAKKQSRAGQKVAAKYRNPATGDTWTGRGKPPRWIQGKDRAQFSIA
jgi:DNA-binding protein H-NS